MGHMGKPEYSQLNFFEPLDIQIKQPKGNKQLVEYGILQEASDFRIHVAYKIQHIYVFPTKDAVKAIFLNDFKKVPASVDGDIITAKGFLAPPDMIQNMQKILIPLDLYKSYPIQQYGQTTTTKGLLAINIVVGMLKKSLINLPVKIDITDDLSIQIKGADIIVSSSLRLQVKCDYKAGDQLRGGTGNLFLQTEECNPYKLI